MSSASTIFGRPFVKVCPMLSVLFCLSVCDVGVLWHKSFMDQDDNWYGGRPHPGHIVFDRDPAPPKRDTAPQFSAYVCCRQMAGWIKVPLSMDVDLGPGDIVLDRDLALPKGAQQPPQSLTHVYCGQRLDGSRCHLVWR